MFNKIMRHQVFMLLADIVLVNVSVIVALLLRFEGNIAPEYLALYKQYFVLFTFIQIFVFYVFGLYRNLWQYASTTEMINLSVAVTVAALFLYVTRIFDIEFPRSMYFISWGMNLLFIGGVRFSLRLVQDVVFRGFEGQLKKVLIIGAGEAGVMVSRELGKNRDKLFSKAVGFIDDDPKKKGSYIQNIPILGSREDIPRIITEKRIDEVVIAIPSASPKSIREIVDICKQYPVKLKILPGVYELIDEKVVLKKMRDLRIEDLLRRDPVSVNLSEIAAYLEDEIVLVTGGGGSIGSELCRQILKFRPRKLLILGHGENSIYNIYNELIRKHPDIRIIPLIGSVQDKARMEELFEKYRPTNIFHAAAHKHVPLMEDNPGEAIKNNIIGTRNVAEVADKFKAKRFVMISTDKAVNTTNVMGATKRVAEMIIQTIAQNSKTKFCAVRFGNVLGSRGSVVPLFQKQIDEGGPITVTHPDMVRYFMTIPEAVQLVIQAGAMGQKGEIFVLNMGEPVKIVDLAADLIKLSGYEPGKDIDIVFTGIRPGEKLYEEMLSAQEELSATKHEHIFIANASANVHFLKELKSISEILQVDYRTMVDYVPGLVLESDRKKDAVS